MLTEDLDAEQVGGFSYFLFFSSLEIDEIEPEGKRKANKQQRS